MTDRNQGGALRTFSPEQADKLFHSPALRHLFQENASDEYALIWLLSKHTKDTGSEKIYLKDIVRELNLPMPKVSAIARSLQNKGLVRWTHDGNGEEGTYILLTDTAVTSVQAHRQTLRAYHQRVVAAYGEEKFLHLLGEIAQLEEIMRQEAEKVGGAHDPSVMWRPTPPPNSPCASRTTPSPNPCSRSTGSTGACGTPMAWGSSRA